MPSRGADLGPGVAALTQAFDCYGYRGVDVLGQAEHEGQGLDVAIADATAVGRKMRCTNAVYSSFSTCRLGRFDVNRS
jgi:hypothetical protein